MGDTFISYKAEDRARVRPLVAALQADGIDLWWDVAIEGGASWRQTIQQQLDAARCVLVVWSKLSAGPAGNFVHDEATRAQRRGIYLPVRIDKVEPPIGFGEAHALDLIGWKGDRHDPRYLAVLDCVRSVLRGGPRPMPALPAGGGMTRRTALATGGVGVVALGAGGWWLHRHLGSSAPADSIAVLPLANLSGDPAQAYFSDGLSEELRSSLSRIAGLQVAARTSSDLFRDARDAGSVAHKLGVAWLLEGSVRRDAKTIRVTSQLIDGQNGLQHWSDSYDQATGDALTIQTAIAEKVAAALQVKLGGKDRAAIGAGGTHAADAHDLFLQGKALLSSLGTEQALHDAIVRFDGAIAIDPNYAEAHAARARALWTLAGQFDGGDAAARDSTAALVSARRAVALAPGLAVTQLTLGYVLAGQLQSAAALPYYERARTLGAGDADILASYAGFISRFGRSGQAIDAAQKAERLDPLNPRVFGMIGGVLKSARRYDDAIAAYRQTLALNPKSSIMHWAIGECLTLLGRHDEALAEIAQEPVDWARATGLAIAAWRKGDHAASDKALAELQVLDDGSAAFQLAEVYAQRGDTAAALDQLDHAWATHDGGLVGLKTNPMLDPIRGEPRFKALLGKLGLA